MRVREVIQIVVIALLLIYITSIRKEVEYITIPPKTNTKVVIAPRPVKLVEDLTLEGEFAKATPEVKIEMFKDAVTIRDYEEELVDSVQTITVNSRVQGRLLEQIITYRTNPVTIERKTVKSSTEFFLGGFTTIPTVPMQRLGLGAEINIKNNNKIYGVGYDINGNISASISFKLF